MNNSKGRYKPLYVGEKNTYWGKGSSLFLSTRNKKGMKLIARRRSSIRSKIENSNRLLLRFFRGGFHSVLPLKCGAIVAIVRGEILYLPSEENIFQSSMKIMRGSRPLNICYCPNEFLYFGEYFDNKCRDEVNIYGSSDGQKWSVVYTFPKNSIRHIHGIYYDKYRNGMWVLTGDKDDECNILFTGDNFKTLVKVFSGRQNYRAVTIIPLEGGLIVPTDTPMTLNKIQWIDVESNKIETIMSTQGSVFYSAVTRKRYALSVIVEPSKFNLSRIAQILISDDEGLSWSIGIDGKKDIFSMKYFQYGAFYLPYHEYEVENIYTFGMGLKKYDNKHIRL
jgi:hypothetical protein